MRRTPRKSGEGRELALLEDIPNVGPAIAADLRQLGIRLPSDLPGRDPYAMYEDLCRITGQRHDPCLLDTFIAAIRFMEGEPKKPWWKYTAERKRELAARRQQEMDSAGAADALEVVTAAGRVLRVRAGFDADVLRQLLAVLEEPPC
jgi:hypothetical protein